MKRTYVFLMFILLVSCEGKKPDPQTTATTTAKEDVVVSEFQSIIDSADVTGSVLIYDVADETYYSNDFQWAKRGHLPASTFKIANSIIALETGTVENDSTRFKWNGEKRESKVWEQDLVFRDAFHFSCVPCYQEVARSIGVSRMLEYLKKLEYGDMKVDSTNIDLFWLVGESRISQFQQIDFLEKFYRSELPISERTSRIMKGMMIIEEHDGYKLSGKTGWSIRDGNNNGWFVGYLEIEDNVLFFATNVEPKQDFEMDKFPMIRKYVTIQALEQLTNLE